jgi:hypothetical protein
MFKLVSVVWAIIIFSGMVVWAQPHFETGEEDLMAVISRSTIKVGQSAMVTISGKHLDVAGGNTIGFIGEELASIVEVTPAGKAKFTVKGLAPGNAVLRFSNGKKDATVKVSVVPMGKKYGEPITDLD